MDYFDEAQNFQGTENARKDKVKSARKGNCKEWNSEGSGIDKEWNLQGTEFVRNAMFTERNLQGNHR